MSLDAIRILRKLASFLLFGLSVFPTVAASTTAAFDRYSTEEGTSRLSSAVVGRFRIQWDALDPFILITHTSDADKVLFRTTPSVAFLSVGFATDTNPPIVDGNFKVGTRRVTTCNIL
jgi:hypothetical protein